MIKKVLVDGMHDVVLELIMREDAWVSAFHSIAFCALKILRQYDEEEKMGIKVDKNGDDLDFDEIVGKMIVAFELIVADDYIGDKEAHKAIREGLELFSKYFLYLWD